MFSIRPAANSDVDAICEFDHIAQQNNRRCAFVGRSVAAGNCFIIEAHHQVVGYAVLEYSFYEQGFISMLYIHPEYRRQGAGMMLMQDLESICQTPKLFTSTNLSNLPRHGGQHCLDFTRTSRRSSTYGQNGRWKRV